MNTAEELIPHGNDPFAIEVRGFDHIPDAERNMSLRQVDHLWVGTSVNLFSFALGAIAITMGLNLWLALAAGILGNLPYVYLALGSIVSVRAGLPVSTLTRAAFGLRGNLVNAMLSWLASVAFEVINTVFGVEALLALFQILGWHTPGNSGKLAAVMLQLVLCGGIAVLGHATMVWFQRVFANLVGAALVAVIGYAATRVDWQHAAVAHAPMTASTTLGAFLTATAVVAANPLSFIFNGPDWVRYLPAATPGRLIFRHVFWSSFIPTVAITMMGAACATLGDMSDPVAGLKPFVPPGLFVVYIFAVVAGSLANNVPTYYSSGLALQAIGLRMHRHAATLLDVALSAAITLYILFVEDFTTALDDFIALLVVWVGPFGGVWICDALLRRYRYDFNEIHSRDGAAGGYWGWHGLNVPGLIAMAAGMAAATLTMMSPIYDGPIATALGGTDLSWALGLPVASLSYWLLATRRSGAAAAVRAGASGSGT